jgi:hypothetical protein
VVITCRDQQGPARGGVKIGGKALALRNDAGSVQEARRLTEWLQRQDIQFDVLFINACVARFVPFADVTESLCPCLLGGAVSRVG